MTDDVKPAPRRRLPAAERRKRIISAAREVFFEDGVAGSRTKEIADRAGVNEAYLYRYFPSKTAMYEAAVLDPVREGIQALADAVRAIDAEVADPIEFVRAVHRRSLEYNLEFANLHAIAVFGDSAGGRDFYNRDIKPLLDELGTIVAEHAGWAARGLDPGMVRRAVFGAHWVIGLDHALRHSDVDLDELADELTALFTGGVREKQSTR